MTLMTDRKRLPVARPDCPVHLIPMVVYAATETFRYHKCVINGCECRGKTVKGRRSSGDNSSGYLQAEL